MKKKVSHNNKGFTLIETIVAFAIIAIILVVALIGFNTIANVNNRAQAWNKADESLENMIAAGTEYTSSLPATLKVTVTNPGTGQQFSTQIDSAIKVFTYEGKTLEVFQPD